MTDEAVLRDIFEVRLPGYVRESDISGYMSLWDENCMWCPPDLPDRRGLAEVRAGVSELLAEYSIDPTFHADEIKVVGDYGYVNGTSVERQRPRGGGPASIVRTREIWLFVRSGPDWKIARIIFNHLPVPATA